MRTKFVKFSVLSFWVAIGTMFFAGSFVKSSKMSVEEYNLWISESYDFRFGKNKLFSPSNATTFNGQFIDGDDFISASRCAKCHTDTHPQWRESAHANSFREPFYQKNVKDLIKQKNIAFTRHCESCHNPAALFSGALTDSIEWQAIQDTPSSSNGRFLNCGLSVRAPEKSAAGL